MKVLVIGAHGMLGNAVFRVLSSNINLEVFGTIRSGRAETNLIESVDVADHEALIRVFELTKPNVVINCVGLIKQLNESIDPVLSLSINSVFPHRLATLCDFFNSRLIHISTDCVFSGRAGYYSEDDSPDAEDLYGRSKLLGEVIGPNNLTLRTSLIGHELNTKNSLLEWFLSQTSKVSGFTNAIFSGLTVLEASCVIENIIIEHKELNGLYHLASTAISKYELLTIIRNIYKKKIVITPSDSPKINRSLNGSRLSAITGYEAPSWDLMIESMYRLRNL
jgi:dTDP-4-dehydrorhamnose reductase